MSDVFPSTSFQQAANGDNLNSTMMFIFLSGIYTMVYVVSRKASQRRMIVAAITALYLISVLQMAIQWWAVQWEFIEHGDTRLDTFASFYHLPAWSEILFTVDTLFMLIIADGLLIWRCYHLWKGSLRVMRLSLFLWIAEICLSIACLAIFSPLLIQNRTLVRTAVDLEAAVYLISAGQSTMTSVLIAYRIYSVSSWDITSRRKFKGILNIVVQSATIYSLVLLSLGIISILPSSNLSMFALDNYLTALTFLITGLVPTIMVASVALLSPNATYPSGSTTIPQLSVLQFRGSSIISDQNGRQNVSAVVVDHERDGSLEVESKIA